MGSYDFMMKPTMDTSRWEFERKYREENPIAQIDFTDPNRDLGPLHEQRTNMQQAWQKEQEAFRNTPDYIKWQQRQDELGDLSPETLETIRGGQSFSSNPGNSIDAYIRGGGGGYEDYLSTHEKMKEARPQIEAIRNNWQGAQSQDMIDQMNAVYQSVGLSPGGAGGILGGGGGQQQAQRQLMVYDPTKAMGGENWKPMGQEEYERQYDLWGRHMDYRNFAETAQNYLGERGMQQAGSRNLPHNPAFGHAFQAWNKFNQSQPGGPYTDPNQSRSEFGINPLIGPPQLPSSQQPTLQPALGGPLQQKIQQGLGAFAA
jgi:hypothetical protein